MSLPRRIILPSILLTTAASAQMATVSLDARPASLPPSSASAMVATATKAVRAPVIDGKMDDAVWADAQIIDAFRSFEPVEDGDPRFRTEARISYDERNLYVFVRAFDPHPDSIVSLLSRRDVRTQSDQIKLMIDAYHDRRTGFDFAVNPAGVKRDYAIINDGEEDISWDAVWDVAVKIDSLGWTSEFQIPLSQLRYTQSDDHTFGFGIWRDVARHSERYSWPVYHRTQNGLSSQLGELQGIRGIASPRRIEFAPYSLAKSFNSPYTQTGLTKYKQTQVGTAGADLKIGITSNLTVDATINPDFGQVEADPSLVNLSAFETFFPEKRPFFLEGQGLFRFDVNCNDGSCSGLFYSRRIGRSPQLSNNYYDPSNPQASTILGAAKLTGRLSNGMSVGILNAATEREVAATGETIEPRANYFVGRVQQDFRGGGSAIGGMLTSVERGTDAITRDYLRKSALAGGLDFRHQFNDRKYSLNGYVAASRVEGTAAAIARTQRNSVHYYQRPDDGIDYDPTATSMSGYSAQINIEKRAGGRTRGSGGFQILSPGFEINDVGFISRANTKNQYVWYQVQWNKPTKRYRSGNINFNQWTNLAWNNELTELGGNINTHWQMPNSMWLHFGQGVNAAVPSYCDGCLRGGPSLRQDRSHWGWGGVDGDPRQALVPGMFYDWSRNENGRSSSWGLSPSLSFRVGGRLTGSASYRYGKANLAEQPNGNFGVIGNDTTHYTVAALDQKTSSVTARLSYTATPTLSLQVYAQPFSTFGNFSNWMEVADPRAERWTSRFRNYAGGDPGAFDFKQYRSNSVVRWEYRPGSALYLVWAQERTMSEGGAKARVISHSLSELKRAHPANVFLIKGSYWFSL